MNDCPNANHNEQLQCTQRLFDEKAARWSRKYDGPLKSRLELFSRTVETEVPPGTRILDFGCGTGVLAYALRSKGYEVDGLDISQEMISKARSTYDSCAGLSFEQGDLSTLAGSPKAYDAIIASSVLEYLPDLFYAMGIFSSKLRNGGKLIVTLPNRDSSTRRRERFLRWMFGWSVVLPLPSKFLSYLRYLQLSRNHESIDSFGRVSAEHAMELLNAFYVRKESPVSGIDAQRIATMILFVLIRHPKARGESFIKPHLL